MVFHTNKNIHYILWIQNILINRIAISHLL